MTSDQAKATFRKLSPADQDRVRTGGKGSLRGIVVAVGVVKVPTPLKLLTRAWKKASEAERRAFLEANGLSAPRGAE